MLNVEKTIKMSFISRDIASTFEWMEAKFL